MSRDVNKKSEQQIFFRLMTTRTLENIKILLELALDFVCICVSSDKRELPIFGAILEILFFTLNEC